MKKIISVLTLLAGIAVSNSCWANNIDIQNQIINQVETNLPDLNKQSINQFAILQDNSKQNNINKEVISDQKFFIKSIKLVNLPSKLKFLQSILDGKINKEYSVVDINKLVQEINSRLVTKGYVTSKVYIQEQNLSSGILELLIIVGKVEKVEFIGVAGNYNNALAFHTGDILNIRKIEQTVDNINSVLHQKAKVQLEPGSKFGETIVVFDVENSARFEVNTSIDNLGNESIGRLEGNLSIAVAKPFNITDSFYYIATKSFPFDDKKGSKSQYISYQVPIGKDHFSISHTYSDYEQEISYAINPFKSSGNFTTDEIIWGHLLNRDSKQKTEIFNKIKHKSRHSFINNNEIGVQKRRTTSWEIDLHQTRYINNGIVDWTLGYIRGMHWWANPGPTDQLGDATTNYNIYQAKLNYIKQFSLNKNYRGTYKLEFKGQYTTSRLYASEFFNLGGWYGVRGFNGDNNLATENGFYVRNTVEIPTSKVNNIYCGIDYGKVFGTYSSELVGTELVGGIVGIKGQYRKLSYNIFGAYPISKPDGFNVPNKLWGFKLDVQL